MKMHFRQKILVAVLIISFSSVIISPPILAAVPDVQDLGYYSGDAHVHTKYSGDPPAWPFVDVADQAADAQRAGLDWVQFTEHSDFVLLNGIPLAYLTDEEWDQLVAETNQDWGILALPGEEVTVGNGNDLNTWGHSCLRDYSSD